MPGVADSSAVAPITGSPATGAVRVSAPGTPAASSPNSDPYTLTRAPEPESVAVTRGSAQAGREYRNRRVGRHVAILAVPVRAARVGVGSCRALPCNRSGCRLRLASVGGDAGTCGPRNGVGESRHRHAAHHARDAQGEGPRARSHV